MNTVDRLLRVLQSRGLSVVPGPEPGQLLLRGPAEEKTAEVMEALKEFKPLLLARFATSREPETEAER